MQKTELFFPIEPKPKGRPRFTRQGHAYTPDTTRAYESAIRLYYKDNTDDFYESAISIRLTFFMPIPKSATKKMKTAMESGEVKHTKKPDTDNMVKAFTDAIMGVAFEDDSLITKIYAEKKYSSSEVGIMMTITEDVD